MIDIELIEYSERMVGNSSPLYDDTLNRALQDVLEESGYSRDGTSFAGFAKTVHTHDADAIVSGTLDVARGGTDLGSYTAGDMIYATGATTLAKVAIGAAGSVLTSTGSAPQWSASLNTSQGGTGLTTFTAGDMLYYSATTSLSKLGIGTAGQFLRVSGSAPSWATLITSMITDIASANTGITSVGTIATGVWQGTAIADAYLAALSASKLTGTTLPASIVTSSLTAVGTIATGVWQGTQVANAYIASGLDVTKLTAGTTLPSNVVTSSLTAVGTIATGVWQGTSIATTYTDAKIATVTGTSNRLTISGTATAPIFDISSAYIGQATITTLGTITTGVWAGTVITVDKGGTNLSSYTIGDLLYASGATTIAKLAVGTAAQYLRVNAGATAPEWHTLVAADITDLSTAATGITQVGTVTTGIWNAGIIAGTYGGTGVNNGSFTITLAGHLVTSGANSITLTSTGATNVTLPTSGTLVNTAVTSLASLTSVGGAFAISGAFTGATTGAFSSTLQVDRLDITAAASRIVPGATSLAFRNSANNADNILVNDAGSVVFRGALSGMTTIAMNGALSGVTTIATSSTINSQTISATANFTGTAVFASTVTVSANGITVTGNSTITGTLGGITTLTATTVAGTLSTAAQPNITSVGTLTGLTVNGTTTLQTSGSARFTVDSAGKVFVGTVPGALTNLELGSLGLAVNSAIACVKSNGDRFNLISLNSSDRISLAGAYAVLLTDTAAGLPAGAASMNGVVTLDTTNNRIIWYTNGNRYYATGTSF